MYIEYNNPIQKQVRRLLFWRLSLMMKQTSFFSVAIVLLGLFILCTSPGLLFSQTNDPIDLSKAIVLALEQNEQALKIDAGRDASKARLARARSVFFPQISFTGIYNRRPDNIERTLGDQTVTIQNLNALSGTANVSLLLFDPRSFPAYSQVRNQYKSEEARYNEARRLLSFDVAVMYLTTFSVDQVHEAAKHRLAFAQRTLDAARVRFNAGLVSKNDVTRGELELANAQRELIRSGGDVRHTYLALSSLLCVSIDSPLTLPQEIFDAAEAELPIHTQQSQMALQLRQDICALRWQAQSMHAAAKEPLMRWFPSLTLNGQYRITNEAGLQGNNTSWYLGATLNWTLFDGFARFAENREKNALARMADLDVTAAVRQIELSLQDARTGVEVSLSALKQARLAETIARQNFDETSELYLQGLSSALAVADANLRLFEAEVALVRERHGLALSLLELRTVLGLDPFGHEPVESTPLTIK